MHRRLTALFLICTTACAMRLNAQPLPEVEPTYPRFGIKTNLLYDATTTLNLGVEFGLGRRTSLDVPFNYNPWTFSDNKKWKHFLVQPGFRWWTSGERFRGGFWGVHAHYALYNVGGLDNPPFSEYMNQHRFEGWLVGAGVSYGYRWNFGQNREQGSRWGLEAEIGAGYAYLSYDKYPCYTCGKKIGSETKNYFGPTKASISLVYAFGGKKQPKAAPVYIPVAPVAEPAPQPMAVPTIYEPAFAVSYIVPEAETVKLRSETGKVYLDFAAGKSTILPDYKNNAAELSKIHSMIREVKADQNSNITGIKITGYASPEGTYATNMTLSQKRAAALKDNVRIATGFPESMFTVEGKGEDWAGLESLVSNSQISNKEQVLTIIRGTDVFDGRERKLMALAAGVPYRQMLAELFPQLRRVEYKLNYTVLPFTVEQGKEAFKTKPSTLSLNEMFLIAQTYEKGSEQFNELFETAARIFPASAEANLNAAANALSRNDMQSSKKYMDKINPADLSPAQQAAYYNNLGVQNFKKGDIEAADAAFAKARELRNAEALSNIAEREKLTANRAEIERITRQNAEAKSAWEQRNQK